MHDIVRFLVKKNFDKDAFLNAPIQEAITHEMTILVTRETTVKSLLSRFVKYHPYRVAVSEEQGVIGVVSQIDIVRWFAAHSSELFPEVAAKHLFDIPELGSTNKFSVRESDSVRAVLELLAKKKVSGLAVVDDAGVQRTCVAPSNFTTLSADNWPDFSQPISQW